MNKEFKSNSLVIIANSHNPSLFSDYFLLTSGIIDDENQIKKGSFVLTPAFSQVNLVNDININLDPNKLEITSPIGKEPFKIGEKYCKSLNFIKGVAIGINFDLLLSDFDFDDWFAKMNLFKDSRCVEAKYLYKNSNVSISLMKNGNALAKFNFHYQLPKDLALGEVKLNFLDEWKKNQSILNDFITFSFK